MEDELEQDALLYIEGRDEDGGVWLSSTDTGGWHPQPRAGR
jgi:hypothetical protein